MLHGQVQANDPAPGVIAYTAGEPVGWCAIEPRLNYDRLNRSKVVIEGSEQKAEDASVLPRLSCSHDGLDRPAWVACP